MATFGFIGTGNMGGALARAARRRRHPSAPRRYSFTELANPDFGLIARGNGIAYRCVERREELAGAVAEMKACKGAYLLEVRVESEENVFPMVPAGAPVSAIRLE